MDKQLREILNDFFCDIDNEATIETDLANQIVDVHLKKLKSYINDNYVSKDKVRGLKMKEWKTEPHMTRDYTMRDLEIDTHNNAVKEINTAIDTLVSVPTPESEKDK
jgi:hypothetical protein